MKEKKWRNLIEKNDKENMLQIISDFHKQVKKAIDISNGAVLPPKYAKAKSIVVAGMGGSAIGGDLLFACFSKELKIPFHVVRDYRLPAFVDANTLFFAVSYSGNTEETLSAYRDASSRNAKIIGVTSGGKLRKRCEENKNPMVVIPGGMPPRTAVGYLFSPMLICLQKLGYIGDHTRDVEETIELLKELSGVYSSLQDNDAETLAQKLYGRLPIIYGSDEITSAVTLRWRTQINENSKTLAYHHVFPEMNHNEIVGWEKLEQITQNFRVVLLRDKDDHERVKTRMDITKSILENIPAGIDEVWSRGESLLARIFSLLYMGDFVSFYLAMQNGIDPTPVERIESLKKKLAQEAAL